MAYILSHLFYNDFSKLSCASFFVYADVVKGFANILEINQGEIVVSGCHLVEHHAVGSVILLKNSYALRQLYSRQN